MQVANFISTYIQEFQDKELKHNHEVNTLEILLHRKWMKDARFQVKIRI
jgi:hypothetical protein